MMTARTLRTPLTWTIAGMSVLDIAIAIAASGGMIALVGRGIHTGHPHVGAAAVAGAVTMTLPVAWRRREPLAVAGVLAVATLANGLLFGPLVRCGAALPVAYLVAYAVGVRCDRARARAGLLLCAVAVIAEGLYDPQIEGPGLVVVVPVLVAFFAAGLLVRARTRTAQALRSASDELRRQREDRARLAVLADRAQVSLDLESTLHTQIGGIAATAAAGLAALDIDRAGHQRARQALAGIERDGRAVLGHLREVLGTLHDLTPGEPQPTLARLSDLLTRATTADARLTVEGSPRTLPAGLELSGYRIVEHLLLALADAPEAAIDVRLRFDPDALELQVSGPPSPTADLRALLTAARERACLHGGTVDSRLTDGVCYAVARLPLVSSHA
jgi:hypothetical protein